MLRFGRRVFSAAVGVFALLGFVAVPLGNATGFEHVKAFLSTPEGKGVISKLGSLGGESWNKLGGHAETQGAQDDSPRTSNQFRPEGYEPRDEVDAQEPVARPTRAAGRNGRPSGSREKQQPESDRFANIPEVRGRSAYEGIRTLRDHMGLQKPNPYKELPKLRPDFNEP